MLKELKVPLALFVSLYILGILFFRITESLSWIDSFYFVGNTISALGYGDLYPTTAAGKVFATFFSFTGIGIFIYIVGTIINIKNRR